MPGMMMVRKNLEIRRTKRSRHLLEIVRNTLHGVETVDCKDRTAGHDHDEINPALDTSKPKNCEYDPTYRRYGHEEPNQGQKERFKIRPFEQQ